MKKVETGFKSGFVALLGRTNVGKSTLLNTLLGEKIAITTSKPQTTRNRIPGILTSEDGQIIFLDTPGIHKPKHKLGRYMVNIAKGTLAEVDIILFLVDASQPLGPGDQFIADLLTGVKTPIFLLLNKIDLLSRDELEAAQKGYGGIFNFTTIIPVSALTGENLSSLRESILHYLPVGPQYYPEDMLTDQPERFIVAELIREKILLLTREEIPHSIAVEIQEMWEEEDRDLVTIHANIYVERDSQKGIVIGRGGRMLKEIGQRARADIEHLLGCQVFLHLWVKVKKDWRDSPAALRNFGYDG
ncbi:MAG: GTPase Era [Firmicutes bacterium]|nr:GTPase Era [Bacillota bacterium]